VKAAGVIQGMTAEMAVMSWLVQVRDNLLKNMLFYLFSHFLFIDAFTQNVYCTEGHFVCLCVIKKLKG